MGLVNYEFISPDEPTDVEAKGLVAELREKVTKIVQTLDSRMNIHDFRFVSGITHSNLIFDIAVPFEMKDSDDDVIEKVSSLVSVLDPSYFCVIEIDRT